MKSKRERIQAYKDLIKEYERQNELEDRDIGIIQRNGMCIRLFDMEERDICEDISSVIPDYPELFNHFAPLNRLTNKPIIFGWWESLYNEYYLEGISPVPERAKNNIRLLILDLCILMAKEAEE